MNTLRELAQIVSKNKTKRIEIIGHPSGYKSKVHKLYDAFTAAAAPEESHLASTLFPNPKNRQFNYARLKRKLYRKLLNTLFFIDTKKAASTKTHQAYYSSYRDFAAMKILQGRGAHNAVQKLGEDILKRSLKYEFTDLAVEVLRSLRIIYGTIKGEMKEYERVKKLFHQQKELLYAEDLAEGYFSDLAVELVKSNELKTNLVSMAIEYSQELESLEDEHSSQRFLVIAYQVHTIRFRLENNFGEALKYCDRIIQKIEKKRNFTNPTYLMTFYSIRSGANIKLGNYPTADQDISRCLELVAPGTMNWYITLYYKLILNFHCGAYQKAFEVFKEAMASPGFNNLPDAHKESWTIADAYLNYLIAIHQIKLNLKEESAYSSFRLNKFLNDVPVYSKDKRGANISILILQILFLLQKKNYEEIENRLRPLRAYSGRYLRKNETFRSNCFIRALQALPRSHYNRTAFDRNTKPILERLAEKPLEIAEQSSEMELIPYEKLWEMILNSLKG